MTDGDQSRDETTRLLYLKWQKLYETEKPFQIFIEPADDWEDKRRDNLSFSEGPEEVIHDVRGHEQDFALDSVGFAFRKHQSRVENFESFSSIEDVYLPEVQQFIMDEVAEVDEVHIFDWRLRKNRIVVPGALIDMNDAMKSLLPARHVHVDQSPSAVIRRVQLHIPDRAHDLLQGRVRIINVWRPIKEPVQDYPLALCDGSTVLDADLIETDHIRMQYSGSALYVKYSERYRWYYLNEQAKDEVTMIKIFDSENDIMARCCPHASFKQSNIPASAPSRESIEVRALVFTYYKE